MGRPTSLTPRWDGNRSQSTKVRDEASSRSRLGLVRGGIDLRRALIRHVVALRDRVAHARREQLALGDRDAARRDRLPVDDLHRSGVYAELALRCDALASRDRDGDDRDLRFDGQMERTALERAKPARRAPRA